MYTHVWFLIMVVIGSASTIYLAGIAGCNRAFACECAERKSPVEEISEAEAVFSGKVTAITYREDRGSIEKIVSLDVGRAWKGVTNDTVTVVTGEPSASCGFPFEENREYLVYAHGGEKLAALGTSGCSRTAPIENAQADLFFLGPGNPMQRSGGLAIETEFFGYLPLIIGFGAAIAGVLAFLLRPQKQN